MMAYLFGGVTVTGVLLLLVVCGIINVQEWWRNRK